MSRHHTGGRRWRELVRRVVWEEAGICHLCGLPGATSADHLIPVSVRKDLEFVRENLRAAHKRCNTSRGASPLPLRQAIVTSRDW